MSQKESGRVLFNVLSIVRTITKQVIDSSHIGLHFQQAVKKQMTTFD